MSQEQAPTKSDRETRVVNAAPGAVFPIRLWEDRTRGEQWVPTYDPAGLVLVSDDFVRTVSNNAVDTGKRTFEFRAVAPGRHELVFEKRMGWKFTAEDRRVYLVDVQEDGTSAGR